MANLASAVLQPGVGVVTGQISQIDSPNGLLMQIFRAYEHCLRRTESNVDSVVEVTGAIYAIRRRLWTPLPSGLINDDVFVPLAITSLGYRALTCNAAFAIDRRASTPRQEFLRRALTLTGILQLVRVRPAVLNPLANRLWLQCFCHKLLRFCIPFWIVLTLLILHSDMTRREITLTLLAIAAVLTAAVLARLVPV